MNERPDAPERLPLQELVGTTLGEYRVKRIVGYGSMGVVFEAHHEKLDRLVALKALPPGLGATEKAIQRFLREAQAVAQLSHESIVPIYEIRQTDAIHWYVMRFLEGDPLDRLVKAGPIDGKRAARLLQTAARAIHFAHQHGIIHRDIKPANMILDGEGRLVITDFGLARPEQGAGITDSGAMVGTPLYMSPEQIRARKGEIDRRTDIWSLGATLFELATGASPFTGESTQEILQNILEVEPRSPRALRADLHPDLEVIILKALEKEPKRRYTSALDMAQDLERFLEGEPITARRTNVFARGLRHVRKHKTIVSLAAAIVVILMLFAWASKRSRDQQHARAYESAMKDARGSFADGHFLIAADEFDEALRERKGDDAARLGRARAWCSLGQDWEQEIANGKTRPALSDRFGTVDRLYAAALVDLSAVLEHQPEQPVAAFYRGFLRIRSREEFDRDSGPDDLFRAMQFGSDDWETQLEFAKFRFAMTNDPDLTASKSGELIQTALRDAARAVQLLQKQIAQKPGALLERWLGRALKLRGELYSKLYATGNVVDYLELALSDYEAAWALDDRDTDLFTRRNKAIEDLGNRKADLAKAEEDLKAASSRTLPAQPTNADPPPDPDLARNLRALFNRSDPSAQSKVFAAILARGGDLIAPLLAGAGDLGEGVLDNVVNPYFEGAVVTDAARLDAEAEAERARTILQDELQRGEPRRDQREQARDHLRSAITKNPRNSQYGFELAVLEQALGEFGAARAHLETAVAIAPSNPIFRLQLALVCEQLKAFGPASLHAAEAAALAPGSVKLREIATRLRGAAEAAAAALAAEAALPPAPADRRDGP